VIWVGAEQQNFLLWDSTAAITPNLARRAVDFLHDVIRHRDGKREFGTSGKSPVPISGARCRRKRLGQGMISRSGKAGADARQ
jgi:hypothetical protein